MLIELLLTIGLAALLIPALFTGFTTSRGGRAQQEQRMQAIAYFRQAQEALRIIQSNDWLNLTNGTFHPAINGNTWELVSGPESISGTDFTREINIADVFRDTNGNIASSGGTLDPSTKLIVLSVSWTTPSPSSVSGQFYLTRHENNVKIDSTIDDFNPGATSSGTTGVTITDTDGGEVVLGAGGGGGDWCQPSLTLKTLDLPKNGVANAISAIEGEIFAGTGENASGVSFADVDVTTSYPPTPTLKKSFDGYKTNAVFGETGFAYLATDTNSKEVVIINLSEFSDPPTNSKYKEEGYFDAPGNGSGESIYTYGNYGYMTSGNKFYIFDISSKTGSRTQVNTSVPTLSGTGVKIQVVGNYAYVATNSTSNQLQVIDISDPVNPSIIGNLSSNPIDGLEGRDVFENAAGTRAYLVTASSSTKNELFIINTENPASPTPISNGVYDTAGMDPKGVTAVTGNRVIIVGTGGSKQYQVVNINIENAPTSCGNGLSVPSGINGLASVLQSDGYAYSYIITGDSDSELKIILGGAGAGSNYNSTGVYESATFDAGSEVAWNTISATTSVPSQTTLQYKIAVKDAIGGSCSAVSFTDADFVGSTGQATSFFPSTGGILPFDNDNLNYENPGQCMRYRFYMTSSDSSQTPVVYDFSINYSP